MSDAIGRVERLRRACAAVFAGLLCAGDHLRVTDRPREDQSEYTAPPVEDCPACDEPLDAPHTHGPFTVWPTEWPGMVLLTDADTGEAQCYMAMGIVL